MNNAPRETLRDLVARYGPGICSDAKRCEGLLRDLCGEHRREINLLISALKERAPLDLLAAQNSTPRRLLLTRLAKRLEDQLSVTEGAARWAVDSWALALGVVTDDEVAEREKEFARATPQAAEDDERKRPQGQLTIPAPAAPQPQKGQPARQTQPPPQPPPLRRTRAPQTLPPQPARPPATIGRNPFAWPPWSEPAQGQADPTILQPPSDRSGRPGLLWSFRGCVFGCVLLVLLTFVLFVGLPFVLSVLREEQQQRSSEPPPVQTR